MKCVLILGKVLRTEHRGITGLETAIVLIAFVVVSSVFAFAALSTGLFSSDKSKETINAGLKEASGTLEVRGSIIAQGLKTTNVTVINTGGATTGSLANTPVVPGSETLSHSVDGVLTKVASSPGTGDYVINYTTGLITTAAMTGGSTVTADYTAQLIDEMRIQVANAAGGGAVDLTPGETIITYVSANQSLNIATADITVTGLGSADSDKLVEPGEMYEIKLTGLVSALNPDLKTDIPFTLAIKPSLGAVITLSRTTPVVLEIINDLG